MNRSGGFQPPLFDPGAWKGPLLVAGLVIFSSAVLAAQDLQVIEEAPVTLADREHWAFRPLQESEPPDVANTSQVHNPIDRFMLAKLEAVGLKLMPEADPGTLVRRLSFDLTGLPPDPAEVAAFEKNSSPRAYEELVDRFLDSPAYGERWAQHWLDVARFAESDGFEFDKVREEAWRYRDWVIKALNEDMPYDRFVRLQIAGDELEPENPDSALATGFLLGGPDMPDINLAEERRHTVLNEMTGTVGAAFLGLSLGCATCHDHKSDPVSQADFYRLRAFFDNARIPERGKQLAHVLREANGDPPVSRLMLRGDFRSPGPELRPAYLRVLNPANEAPVLSPPLEGATSSGRRSTLAGWITHPDNPLTPRVIVNRLWQHHFVRPIVATPNDFGRLGDRPTHPELLDWLATELPRQGWSLKEMHRLMVTSATYRQASFPVNDQWNAAVAADPENELFSRMNRRRLSGEAIRDSMLAVAARLNSKTGGPGFCPPLPEEITMTLLKDQWELSTDPDEHRRRSIYLLAKRNLRFPIFDVFDRPDGNASCARRNSSTTAPQSLTLLNSEFSLDCARHLAGLALSQAAYDPAEQIRVVYRRAFGRLPSANELSLGEAFLQDQAARLKEENRDGRALAVPLPETEAIAPSGGAALTDLCLAILNSNPMVYVD